MRILRGTVSCQHCAASFSDDPDFYEKEKPVQGSSVPDYDIIGKQGWESVQANIRVPKLHVYLLLKSRANRTDWTVNVPEVFDEENVEENVEVFGVSGILFSGQMMAE